jgi:hypothetical protein
MKFCHLSRMALGRPNIDWRKAAYELVNPYKLSHSGYVVKCENSAGLWHNYKGCHLPLNLE